MNHRPSFSNDSIEFLHDSVILYPRFEELKMEIARCEQLSHLAGEPQCMSLEGETGAGKSTLIKNYIALNAPYEGSTGRVIPYFYVMTPSPVTVKGMASTMLEYIGDPAYTKGSLTSMNSRLVKYIKECKVRLVFLDEIQQLISPDTDRVLDDVSDWLKVLIKSTGVPFVVVGMKDRVSRILDKNPQLSRLFAAREVLEPFDFKDTDTVTKFNEFIVSVEKAAHICFANEIDRKDLLYRIHGATRGNVGNIVNLLGYAAMLAQEKQLDTITLRILSIAFEKRIAKHLKLKANPFKSS